MPDKPHPALVKAFLALSTVKLPIEPDDTPWSYRAVMVLDRKLHYTELVEALRNFADALEDGPVNLGCLPAEELVEHARELLAKIDKENPDA